MLKRSGFEVLIASPPEYERLVAEVYFDGLFVAMVTQEKNDGSFELEMPGKVEVEELVIRRVDAFGFMSVLGKACDELGAGP